MLRKLGMAVLFIALGSVTALAADFNGKWTAQVESPRGTMNLTFNFHVDGAKLTGTITTMRGDTDIQNGKVDGDNISFDQDVNFNGNDFKIAYTGKADGPDSIKFSRQFGDRPAQEFTAKRGDAGAAPAEPAAQPQQ
jgi:hypothetical protein